MLILQPEEYSPSKINTVTVAIFAMQPTRRVLLLKRNPHAYRNYTDPFPYAWELIGGHAEFHEKPVIAAEREIEEETHLTGLTLELFGISPFISRNEHVNNWVFEATLEKDCPVTISSEHLEFSWVPLLNAQNMQLAFKHSSILKTMIRKDF